MLNSETAEKIEELQVEAAIGADELKEYAKRPYSPEGFTEIKARVSRLKDLVDEAEALA